MTPAGIEPATFRFVAQHLNHCATAVPHKEYIPVLISVTDCHHEDGDRTFFQKNTIIHNLTTQTRRLSFEYRSTWWKIWPATAKILGTVRLSSHWNPGLPNARQSSKGTSAAVGREVGNHPGSGYDTTLLRKRATVLCTSHGFATG